MVGEMKVSKSPVFLLNARPLWNVATTKFLAKAQRRKVSIFIPLRLCAFARNFMSLRAFVRNFMSLRAFARNSI